MHGIDDLQAAGASPQQEPELPRHIQGIGANKGRPPARWPCVYLTLFANACHSSYLPRASPRPGARAEHPRLGRPVCPSISKVRLFSERLRPHLTIVCRCGFKAGDFIAYPEFNDVFGEKHKFSPALTEYEATMAEQIKYRRVVWLYPVTHRISSPGTRRTTSRCCRTTPSPQRLRQNQSSAMSSATTSAPPAQPS